MSRKTPHAAFVEEYDEDAHISLPETRQVANLAREPFVEAASDSGYSSRTAATRPPPVPLKRVRSRTKERPRDRSARPTRDDKMHAGPLSAGYPPAHIPRSPSRPQRLERTYTRNYPSSYWDAERGVYHASTPVEPQSSYDYPPPSPQTPRYHPSAVVQVSHSSRPPGRPTRSNSYHANNRPVSYHGMMPPMNGIMYGSSPRYDHGPPLSSSAYLNSQAYPPAPSLYSQQSSYYGFPDATSPPDHHDRSLSRPREQHRSRRPSVFEPPAIDYITSEEEEEEEEEEDVEEEPMEPTPPPPPPGPPRQARARRQSVSQDRGEEDYYRSMPPPPVKYRAPPQIIQKRPDLPRKSATTSIMSERRPSRSLDMSDLRDVLPEYGYRGSSGGTVIPERNRSLREGRRPSVYHDSGRSAARIAVENSTRRRRPTMYDLPPSPGAELEEKQRDVEEYQASHSGKSVAAPMTISDAIMKAKASSQHGSDSGSQKSRSASSRGSGSDARTRSASGALTTTRAEDNDDIVMTINGVTMSFTQESVGGKRINMRTGQTGAVELNIEGGKRPKKYLANGSDYTTTSSNSRKERKSDRASRRSSRSTYGGRF
ncbi:uncharacterized protein BDV17DRAFT_279073 [Aspergillus undulatus]|uniref:uncharacterized protein n=1 Tax=Aspergillus undulatus TaxID=1810928 RepID=UPI003CCCC1CF